MPNGKAVEIALTAHERDMLGRNVRSRKRAPALAQRSRMILLAADGLSNEAIAKRLGVSAVTVGTWRRRFAAKRLAGLRDERRVGRPREIGDEKVEAVIVATLQGRPEGGAHWSTRSMAENMGMSQSAISRIWRAFGLASRHARRSDASQPSVRRAMRRG
jgi:transposase